MYRRPGRLPVFTQQRSRERHPLHILREDTDMFERPGRENPPIDRNTRIARLETNDATKSSRAYGRANHLRANGQRAEASRDSRRRTTA